MRKANLMLHCGGCPVRREQLAAVATPEPTSTWSPIPHSRLLEGVSETLEASGLTIVGESHALARDDARYFGLLQVADKGKDDDGDFGLVVGVRNSHDKSFPAGLVVGASVFVCDNLSFSGEIKLARKHTVFINRDLPQLITRAIGKLGGLRQTQEHRFEVYKGKPLSVEGAHDLVIRSIDARVLPVTKLPHVLKEWRQPSHVEFTEFNVWRLFNAMTEALKGNVDALPNRTQALHGLMDAYCGLEAMAV